MNHLLEVSLTPGLGENQSLGQFTHEPRAMTVKLWEPKRKCPKAVPRHLHNYVVWSRILKCSVKSYVTGLSTICYFNEFLFMRVLTHDKIKQNINCENRSAMVLLVLRQAYLHKMVLGNNPSDHETWSIWCHVELHVDLKSILHSHTLLVPQA